VAGHQDSRVSGKRIEGGRWWICIFGIVTVGTEVYTLGRYVWEDTVFLYEVFRCLGDYIRSGGVFCATAFRGFEELYGLVFRSDDVREAFALAKIFGLPPEIAAGLILTGSAPGAMASNVMSYIAKADTAYSISLTTVSTLLAPLLTPGLTFILARSRLEVPFWGMVVSVIKMVIVPLFIGFGVRHYLKEKLEKVLPVFPAISVTFIIFICALVIALNKDYLAKVTGVILAAGVVLNIFGMLAGYGVGSAFRMEVRRRRTLAIEIGMQNAGLGTVLALKHFGEKAAIPAAIFVFICIITASIMAEVWQRTTFDKAQS